MLDLIMISCRRRLQWCSGHRVMGHEHKCGHLHGHNYVGYFYARAPNLDSIGRVIDFSVLKDVIGSWIDQNWDHGMILCTEDLELISRLNGVKAPNGENQKLYLMEQNPTAENMAHHLLVDICPTLFKDFPIEVYKIVIQETENCSAEACLEKNGAILEFPSKTAANMDY